MAVLDVVAGGPSGMSTVDVTRERRGSGEGETTTWGARSHESVRANTSTPSSSVMAAAADRPSRSQAP